jgi:hypothetical protein
MSMAHFREQDGGAGNWETTGTGHKSRVCVTQVQDEGRAKYLIF